MPVNAPHKRVIETPAPFPALTAEGVPSSMVVSFTETAKSIRSILMSRVPGGVCKTFIDEGYDLKGYHIKSKSCNWGPMGGFICRLPPFNKKGMENFLFNYAETIKYLEYLKENPQPGGGPGSAIGPFYPLFISEARKELLLNQKEFFNIESIEKIDDNHFYGIAHNDMDISGRSVTTEFLLKRKDDLWNVFHGLILIRPDKSDTTKIEVYDVNTAETFIDLNPKFSPLRFKTESNAVISFPDLNDDRIKSFFNLTDTTVISKINDKRKGLFLSNRSKFFPVQGIINPDFPFPEFEKAERFIVGPNFYKNCVSGDFDLFAAWPEHYYENELQRESEKKWIELKTLGDEQIDEDENIALQVNIKTFTARSHIKKNIFIEFIPHFDEIKKLEDVDKGNINPLIQKAVDELNAFSSAVYSRGHQYSFSANKAFHSDEGGRPGVFEIEFPLAVFIPEDFGKYVPQQNNIDKKFENLSALLLTDELEFLLLMKFSLSKKLNVILNYGWLIHLMALTFATKDDLPDNLKSDPEILKYYNKIAEKLETKTPAQKINYIENIKFLLKEMLFPSDMMDDKKEKLFKAQRAILLKFVSKPGDKKAINNVNEFTAETYKSQ